MNRRRSKSAFTLIELLVVIGIIAVLIAILVPVVGKVRLSAQVANATNQVHRISAAIAQYQHDYNAYPGLLPNSAFAPPGPGAYFQDKSGMATFTQAEDMALALRGGLNPGFPYGRGLVLNPLELDLGPMGFTSVVVPRKHPYVDRIAAEFPPEDPKPGTTPPTPELHPIKDWAAQSRLTGLSYVVDSYAPEYLDTFSDPRPILYIRANGGAAQNPNNIIYNSMSGGFNTNIAYDLAVIQGYLKNQQVGGSAEKDDFHDPVNPRSSGFTGVGGNLDPTKAWVHDYFTSPSGNSAKGGGYLLISAGADRIFGTADDIIVGAGGGI